MNDSMERLRREIQKIAEDAIMEIPDIVFGIVTSVDPLVIQLGEQGAEIPAPFIIRSPFTYDKKLTISVDGDTQEGLLWRGLSDGDRVLLVKSSDGQKYWAVQRTDGATDYNDEISWELSSTTSVEGSVTVQGSNIVQYARTQIGIREIGSSNNVKYNTWYYGRAVQGTAYPWCAVFVSYCANACGISTAYVPRSAAVLTFENFYSRIGQLYSYGSYTPVPGDFYSTPQNGHIGIVETVNSATDFYGIEGNYSNQVARVHRTGGLRYVMHPSYPS